MLKRLTRILKWVGLGLLLLVVLVVVAWVYWGYSPIPGEPTLTSQEVKGLLHWGEQERNYAEYIPPDLPEGAPLVVVLHGSKMNGSVMRIATGYRFDQLADQKKFAVVYPTGYRGHWNDCRTRAKFSTKRDNIDDVGFLDALIQRMVEQHRVDPARVYLVGFSNGGQMAFRLGAEQPQAFAGMATAGASLPVPGDSSCDQKGPTPPLLLMNGTEDRLNDYEGGESDVAGYFPRGAIHSALETMQIFAARNGAGPECGTTALPDLDEDDGTRVTRHDCLREGKPYVVFYSIDGGGHVIPQPLYRFPRMYGRTSLDISLPDAAVAFFGL